MLSTDVLVVCLSRWGDNSYGVEYVTSTVSPLGPFVVPKKHAHILSPDPAVAQGTGSNGVIHVPGTDEWYIVYHRRPLGDSAANHRYVCIDRMEFDDSSGSDGAIKPVKITTEGVLARPLSKSG